MHLTVDHISVGAAMFAVRLEGSALLNSVAPTKTPEDAGLNGAPPCVAVSLANSIGKVTTCPLKELHSSFEFHEIQPR